MKQLRSGSRSRVAWMLRCLSIEVSPTDDPLVWTVEEEFVDAASSAAHQDRVAGSTWGRAAAGIQRDYTIDRI